MTELPFEKAQRLRIRFARLSEATSIGHLDLTRIWERALKEAGLTLSYSQGNRPLPRITMAAGLPVGVTSAGELLDVILARPAHPEQFLDRVPPHLPPGLEPLQAWEIGMGLPSLPAAVRWAEYELNFANDQDTASLEAAVSSFLSAERFPWEDTRGEKVRRYDLRALVQEVRVQPCASGHRLWMRLRCDASGVGRPDQVAKALRLPDPDRIHRLRLQLTEVSPARDAWRRRGRFLA